MVASSSCHAGHDKHAGHSVAMFRDKFWISLALTVPTLIWGHMLQGSAALHRAGISRDRNGFPAVFGTAVFLYGGRRSSRERSASFAIACPG